jgi:HSP20 family protein
MSRENRSIRVAVVRPSDEQSTPPAGAGGNDAAHPQMFLTPPIDIHEGPDGLILEADLPGTTENSLGIQLEENVLSLHGRVHSPAPEGARAIYEEYHLGDFYRSFILSDEVERSRITAELKNGVLRLTLPKADRAKTRRIEIKS